MVNLNECEDLLSYYIFNDIIDIDNRFYNEIYSISNKIVDSETIKTNDIFYIIFASFYLNTNYYITGIGNSAEDCDTQDELQKLIDRYKTNDLVNILTLINYTDKTNDILLSFWRLCSGNDKIIEYIIKTFFDGLAQYPFELEWMIIDISTGNIVTPYKIDSAIEEMVNAGMDRYIAAQILIVNPKDTLDDDTKDYIKSQVITDYKERIKPGRQIRTITTLQSKRVSARPHPYKRGGKLTVKANKKKLFKKTKKKKFKKSKSRKHFKSKKNQKEKNLKIKSKYY